MAKPKKPVSEKKAKRKELMTKIFSKISDAMKEYAKPSTEKKMTKKIKKTSRTLSDLVEKKKK